MRYGKERNMLVSKNIQIEFADSSMKAIDAIHDIREGVRSASLNLYSRYDVQIQTPMLYGEDKVVVEIKIPEDRVENFAIGPHLKGVANYLLKSCNGRYDQYVGQSIPDGGQVGGSCQICKVARTVR